MFGRRKIVVPQKIETLIGKETEFKGALKSRGSIRIDGHFKGDLFVQNDTIIGEAALVQAHIRCSNMILAGRVEGDVCTRGRLDVRATGVLIGDMEVGSLVVEDGAVLTGRCAMKERDDKRAPAGKPEKMVTLRVQDGQDKISQGKQDNPDDKDKEAPEPGEKDYAAAGKGRGKKR